MYDLVEGGEFQDPQSSVAEAARRAAQERQQQVGAVQDTAFSTASAPAAKAFNLSQRTGQPPSVVEQDPTAAEKLAKQQAMAMMRARQKNPVTARMMEELWFAKVAQNDVEHLAETEGLFSWIGRQFNSGLQGNEIGVLGLSQAFGDSSTETEARLRELETATSKAGTGFIGGALNVAGQLTETLPPALGIGAAASAVTTPLGGVIAGGATAFSINSAIAAGQSYRQMRLRGIPHNEAFTASTLSGIGQGTLETVADLVGAKVFGKAAGKLFGKAGAEALKDLTAGAAKAELVKSYLKVLATEVGTETLQEGVQAMAENHALRAAGFAPDDWSVVGARMADTFAQTVQSVALLSGFGPAANYIADMRIARGIDARTRFFDQLGEKSAATSFAETSPSQHESFLHQAGEENGRSTVVIQGEALQKVLAQADREASGTQSATDTLEAKVPGTRDAITAAVNTGGDVTLPLASVVKTTLFDALKPHMRFDSADPSLAEFETAMKDDPEIVKTIEASIDKQTEFDEQAEKELTEIKGTLAKQFTTAKVARGQAAANAQLIGAFIRTVAPKLGLTPKQFFEKYPLSVTRGPATQGEVSLSQPDRGQFNTATGEIRLNTGADASTFLHESGHGFLAIYTDIARSGAMPESMKQDLDTFTKWAGTTTEKWLAAGLEEQRAGHEKFATAFEDYLATGKAPTEELRGLFNKFMQWLKNVYKELAGKQQPAINPEIRAVMDRMLASEEAIANTQAIRGIANTFTDRSEFTGTDEQWQEYQDLQATMIATAEGKLALDSIRQSTVVKNLRRRGEAALAAQDRAARKVAGAQAETDVNSQPVYRLRTWLKKGKLLNEDGSLSQGDKSPNHKLNTAEIREIAGVAAHDWLTALEDSHSADGVSVEDTAAQFTYPSGEAMLKDLTTAPSREVAVETRINEILAAENPELTDPTARDRLITQAIHDEARTRLTAASIRFVDKQARPDRLTIAGIKAAVATHLENTAVREIRPRKFSALTGRASREARAALKRGDTEATAQWLRRELFNTEAARQSLIVDHEIEKTLDRWKQFFGNDAAIAKTRNLDVVNAARTILASYGAYGGSKLPSEFLEPLAKYDAGLYARLAPSILAAVKDTDAHDYRNLSLTEFRQLDTAVQTLWEAAKRSKSVATERGLVAREAAVADMVASAVKVLGIGQPMERPLTLEERASARRATLPVLLRKTESYLLKLDGGDLSGPWQRFLFRPLRQAFDRYISSRARMTKELHNGLKALDLSGTKIEAPELGPDVIFENMNSLLGAIQQAGNESNKRILLLGHGWGRELDDGLGGKVLDSSKWDAFMRRMWREGRVTKAHMDFIQHSWDMNESLLPLAQKVNHDAYGTWIKEIKAQPFSTPFGDYRGGYSPATVDKMHPNNKDIVIRETGDLLLDWEMEVQGNLPGVGKSFTIERTGATRPVLLDLRQQINHFDQVLRFIHLQPVIRDAVSLLKNDTLSGYLNGVDPHAIEGLLMPWLKDTASNRITKPGKSAVLDSVFSYMRRTVGLSFMGFNLRNALQQFTGISNIATYVPMSFIGSAIAKTLKLSGESWNTAIDKSEFMRLRLGEHLGQIDDDIQMMLSPNKWTEFQGKAMHAGYTLQRFAQSRIDVIAWNSAHDHALSTGKSEADAVAQADTVVRLTQGSHLSIDTAGYERNTPFARLFIQFSGYFNTVLNQIWSARGMTGKTKVTIQALMLPALASAAITSLLAGGSDFDDDDHDGYKDEVAKWLIFTQVKAGAAMIPGIGPAVAQMVTSEKRAGDRVTVAPFMSAAQAVSRTLALIGSEGAYAVGGNREEPSFGGQQIRDLATVISTGLALPLRPVSDALSFYVDVNDRSKRNRPRPQGIYDWFSGVTGNRR